MTQARALIATLMLCCATLAATAARAQVLETVLVVGPQPGPGLWKVSKDGNVLWILATFAPLPSTLTWESREVERVLAESQELYTEAGFESFLGSSREDARLMHRAMHNGEGVTLRDVLPREGYEWFARLNQNYAKGANLDELRPFVAAVELRRRSMRTLTLTSDGDVRKKLQRLARKHRVKVRSLTVRDDSYARPTVIAMAALPPVEDVPCFLSQLARLERDLETAVLRANAWAVGDVAALRASLHAESTPIECALLIQRNRTAQQGIDEAERRADVALREALQRNRSTLALIPITALLDPNGALARFRADGYEIEEPP